MISQSQRIEFPEDRPLCPVHGCFMKPRRLVDKKRRREFICPYPDCREKSYRPVKEKLEQSLQAPVDVAPPASHD